MAGPQENAKSDSGVCAMQIVSCVDDEVDTGVMGNHPEKRKRMVKSALEGAGFAVVRVTSPEADLSLATCVHSEELVAFLASAWQRWEDLWKTQEGNRGYLEPFGVKTGSGEVPALVPCYVAPKDGLQRASNTVIGALAMFALDRETPITCLTADQLRFDMAVVRECVERVTKSSQQQDASPTVLYAQVTHPGHHSGSNYFGGFCFLNNAAIAARQISQRLGKKVALLDVDYHAGNGSMQIFYSDSDVLFISLHADPDTEYPFNSGYEDQTGAGAGVGTTLNIPLQRGVRWPQYRVHLQRALDRIAAFEPAALVVSLGLDTLSGDPVAFPTATIDLLPDDFGEMGKMLLKDTRLAQLPKIFFQEGGYLLEDVTKGVLNFFTAAK